MYYWRSPIWVRSDPVDRLDVLYCAVLCCAVMDASPIIGTGGRKKHERKRERGREKGIVVRSFHTRETDDTDPAEQDDQTIRSYACCTGAYVVSLVFAAKIEKHQSILGREEAKSTLID